MTAFHIVSLRLMVAQLSVTKQIRNLKHWRLKDLNPYCHIANQSTNSPCYITVRNVYTLELRVPEGLIRYRV
uniref:AlNc14C80G5264 protein n=1 Tax=Albugo laibachii Nc14 TaxID=890382 RepID=F0WF70_9STRA|nr:AlNc14C80G5264 [Albugo laibachii Nc14]|eukprot:CCA19852.1 AlNc14C80G5264 [Albugo laibachii Nc14]